MLPVTLFTARNNLLAGNVWEARQVPAATHRNVFGKGTSAESRLEQEDVGSR